MFGLLSQLAHVELESPRPAESVSFFTDVLGMYETTRDDRAVYLRGYGDPFHHSLVITEGQAPRIAHIGWRSAGEDALAEVAKRIEDTDLALGWEDGALGHGRAYRFNSPGGHLHEVFWDVERFEPSEEQRSTFPIRPQRFNPIGAAVRQIDHVTVPTTNLAEEIALHRDILGSRWMESAFLSPDEDPPFFVQMSSTEQAHDLGLLQDHSGVRGRSHHFAYWLDHPSDVVRAADVVIESGTPIEYGPGKHGHGENTYLYFREPGGHRVELFSGGYRNYQPDWEPKKWVAGSGGIDMFRNWPAPDSMLEVFPPNQEQAAAAVVDSGVNPFSIVGVS